MKKAINTDKISKMIKESASSSNTRSDINLIQTKKVGNTTFALIKEFNSYIVKSTKKNGNLITEDFGYINGEQNRYRFMRSNLAEAKRFFNFYLSEQQRNPLLKEDDEKYVIKQDVPDQEPEVDMDVDADELDIDADTEGEVEEIEADMEEYQELTGKLAYILRQVEENQKDDVTKYIFNSLIAAMPEISDEVSSSIKEKMDSKLEGTDDVEAEDEGDELNESLRKKGYMVSEKFTKEEALAFFGAKDESGIFVQKPTRFYDGETKEPHMNKGVNKIGKSEPFEDNPASTSKDHPYEDKKGKKKVSKDSPYTEKSKKKKITEDKELTHQKRKRKRKKLGGINKTVKQRLENLQSEGKHGQVALSLLDAALKNHGGPYATEVVPKMSEYTMAFSLLKAMSNRKEPVIKMYMKASSFAKKMITKAGLSILKEDDMDGLWEDIDMDDPRTKMDAEDFEKDFDYEGLSDWEIEDREADEEDEYLRRRKHDQIMGVKRQTPNIEDMLKDEYIEV